MVEEMNDLTIVYYTSNHEDEKLEKKIQNNIRKNCGNLSIISVSQKPIDFGDNIPVGDVGACNHNLFRQIQIGCQQAKTPFVISCEADCLYPPDYFQFKPTNINECYKFTPLYILNEWGVNEYSGFYMKDVAPFAQVTGREHYIKEIDKVLKGLPYWGNPKSPNPTELFKRHRWETVKAETPIVSLKTTNGLRKHTNIIEPPVDFIPFWGDANRLRREMWL